MGAEILAARRVMRETERERERETETGKESAEAEQREAGAVPSRQPHFTSLHSTPLHSTPLPSRRARRTGTALCTTRNGERAPSGCACARTD